MEKTRFDWLKVIVFGCAITMFTACDHSSDEPMTQGSVDFEITDAPSDDANIQSVMVTVVDVKVDGQSVAGVARQTIDLKAYQDGHTKLLGSAALAAKTYSNITLVLDLDADENGNAPGCYVLTKDNVKFKLKSTATGKTDVTLSQSWKVAGNATNHLVMDFDLRKSIRYADDADVKYTFVGDDALRNSVRVVLKENSGTIHGTFEDQANVNAEKIVVYAYAKGTFNANVETQSNADGQNFVNAAGSAEVKESLTGKVYTLAFLPAGEYELHFFAYGKNVETGRYEITSELDSETTVNGSVGNVIKVDAGASVSMSAKIKGLI